MKGELCSNSLESGISVILGIFLSLVLFSFLALSVGIGILYLAHEKLQNTANLIAIGALHKYITTDRIYNPDTPTEALQIAEAIMAQNKVPGLVSLGANHKGASNNEVIGTLTFGTLYTRQPDSGDPCQGTYPCFMPTANYLEWNALKARIQNNAHTGILAPFARIIGGDIFNITKEATAFIQPSCTVVLQDLSHDMARVTHIPDSGGALRIFPKSVLSSSCSNPPQGSAEEIWCSLPQIRPMPPSAPPSFQQFKSDYSLRDTRDGQQLVYTYSDPLLGYKGPQPETDIWEAMNVALRLISTKFGASLWRVIGFADDVTEPIPSDGFADSPAVLTRLYNRNLIGLTDISGNLVSSEELPNFLSFGMYPKPLGEARQTTNLLKALITGIETLEAPQCAGKPKNLVLVTSTGISHCAKSGPGPNDFKCDSSPTIASYNNYLNYELQLSSIKATIGTMGIEPLLVVAGPQTHFINIKSTPVPGSSESFISGLDYDFFPNGTGSKYYDLIDLQHRGAQIFNDEPVVDSEYNTWCTTCPYGCQSKKCKEAYAFINHYKPGIYFGRAVDKLTELSHHKRFCPLLPLDELSHYKDHDNNPETPQVLMDKYRTEGAKQYYAPWQMSLGQQLARCMISYLGPFTTISLINAP